MAEKYSKRFRKSGNKINPFNEMRISIVILGHHHIIKKKSHTFTIYFLTFIAI